MFHYTKETILILPSSITLSLQLSWELIHHFHSCFQTSSSSLQVWSSSILQRNPILQKASRSMEELSTPSISQAPAYKTIKYLPHSSLMAAFEQQNIIYDYQLEAGI